eukprot:SAG31_NODE_2099_length_6447_cov_8.302615_6_plen_207_part_00
MSFILYILTTAVFFNLSQPPALRLVPQPAAAHHRQLRRFWHAAPKAALHSQPAAAAHEILGKGCYFLGVVQLFEKYGTLIERNTALIEKVSALIGRDGERSNQALRVRKEERQTRPEAVASAPMVSHVPHHSKLSHLPGILLHSFILHIVILHIVMLHIVILHIVILNIVTAYCYIYNRLRGVGILCTRGSAKLHTAHRKRRPYGL